VVCAVFVLARGAEPPSVAAVREHVATRLAGYKQPRRVAVVREIPRTPATGQIQRTKLANSFLGEQQPEGR
jgi:acyl-coenzyme A synthetase/AMP-(fatty) acid ligase